MAGPGEGGAGGDGEAGDRTEAATPRRRQTAREAGQVALSREVAPALILGVMALLLGAAAPALARDALRRLSALLDGAERLDPAVATALAWDGVVALSLPVAAVAAAAALAASLGQTGLLLRPAALRPSLGRLNPLAGLRRLVGGGSFAEVGRAALKLALVAAVGWSVLGAALRFAPAALQWPPGTLLDQVRHVALRLVLTVLAGQGVLAVLDLVRARLTFARGLRMSRHEVREEHRESEGDPRIKARIRRLRLQRARRRMMAAVPKATVVVTNPTHYAIALDYQRGSAGAPRVVAKGVDEMARRIREAAETARVPLIANPPLARALWRIELDAEVPADLFQAVAEIIATVWRMRRPRVGPRVAR